MGGGTLCVSFRSSSLSTCPLLAEEPATAELEALGGVNALGALFGALFGVAFGIAFGRGSASLLSPAESDVFLNFTLTDALKGTTAASFLGEIPPSLVAIVATA